MTPPAKSLFRIFKVPALLLAVSLGGLILALVIEGPADIAAALAAGAPIAVVIRAVSRPAHEDDTAPRRAGDR